MPEPQPSVRMHHAALDPAALDCFELNRAAQRHLHPELRTIDLQLQRWAPWAQPRYGQLGYPGRSITERARDGGILASHACRAEPEWPLEVATLDRLIAQLPTRHLAAIFAAYFHLALPAEQRAAVYVGLAIRLARARPRAVLPPRSQRAGAKLGRGAFQTDLDRARWSLRLALRVQLSGG